jgi:hypothetical protein
MNVAANKASKRNDTTTKYPHNPFHSNKSIQSKQQKSKRINSNPAPSQQSAIKHSKTHITSLNAISETPLVKPATDTGVPK